MTTILDVIADKIGTFTGRSEAPTPGSKSATVTLTVGKTPGGADKTADYYDPTNTCRIGIEADNGEGFVWRAWGEFFTGHAGATPPSCTWQFDTANPPKRIRGVLENVTQCPYGLGLSFSA